MVRKKGIQKRNTRNSFRGRTKGFRRRSNNMYVVSGWMCSGGIGGALYSEPTRVV
jgi:hypothetical protein